MMERMPLCPCVVRSEGGGWSGYRSTTSKARLFVGEKGGRVDAGKSWLGWLGWAGWAGASAPPARLLSALFLAG